MLFFEEVLKKHLGPTVFARAARGCKTAVEASGLAIRGKPGAPFKVTDFAGSEERLAWAKANRCPWEQKTCECIAKGGHLEVLRWAREEHHCPWAALHTPLRAGTWMY